MAFQTQSTPFNAVSATLFVHKDHAGFILGKKCNTINGLALTTNTRITGWNEDTESITRKFIICGRSVQDVHRAYVELCQLANIVDRKTPRAHTLHPQHFFPTPLIGIETRIVVPRHAVGILLGTKGNTIHTITKSTGTWAKFYQNDSKNNHMPTFSIRGFYHQDVQKSLQKIHDIIDASTSTSTLPPPLTVANVAQVLDLTQTVQLTQPIQRSDADEPQSTSPSTPPSTSTSTPPSTPPSTSTSTSPSTTQKRVSFKILSKE